MHITGNKEVKFDCLREDMEDPTTANTKKNVEMNSARYDLKASRVTDCSKWAVNEVGVILPMNIEQERYFMAEDNLFMHSRNYTFENKGCL